MDTKEKSIHRIVGDGIGYDAILWVSGGSEGTVADLGGLLETWQQHFQDKELREETKFENQNAPLGHKLASVYGLSEHPYKLGQGKDHISMKVATSESGCFLWYQQKIVKNLFLAISKHINDPSRVIQNQLKNEKIENPALYLVVDSVPNTNNNRFNFEFPINLQKRRNSLNSNYHTKANEVRHDRK